MKEITSYEHLAYTQVEELENELKNIKKRVKDLEILYGTQPPAPDPNDIEDIVYVAPQPGEILSTGEKVVVPVYYQFSNATTFPPLFFTSSNNCTLILKLNLQLYIVNNSVPVTINFYADDTLIDTYQIESPVVNATYSIPFANAYVSQTIGHKLHYVVTPQNNGVATYKMITATYEVIGSNVLILNPPNKYSVYYNDGLYYIAKCEQGYSNYLMQSISGLNLNARYTQHKDNCIAQKFCHSYEYINYVWQPTHLGFLYKQGWGYTYLMNFNDPSKYCVVLSNSEDFLPNLNTYYGGCLIYTNAGMLNYYDVTPDYSSRATRMVDNTDYYVTCVGVKLLYDNFNAYPQKARVVATRNDGTSVFFSSVKNFYKVELGFGAVISANYASENGLIINVYLKVYNNIVKKVLTLNTSTNYYEITSETTIGTWDFYQQGFPPAYFTTANNILAYNSN